MVRKARLVLWLVVLFCFGLSISILVVGVGRLRNAGTLVVKAPRGYEQATISAPAKGAALVRVGADSRTRLAPDIYFVSIRKDGRTLSGVVAVQKQKTTTLTLDPAKQIMSTAGGFAFSQTDSLIDIGLTTKQIDMVRKQLFQFKKTIVTAAIKPETIRFGTISESSPDFSRFFTINIDEKDYDAELITALSNDVRLVLRKAGTSTIVYDSGKTSTNSQFGD